jgi:type I restriction enzyme S subunit
LLAGFAFKSRQFTANAEDIPLVKGENVGQGRILWDIAKRWPAVELQDYEKFRLTAGDVVVAMDRPWVPAGLKWAYLRDEDPQALLVQRVARLRARIGVLDQTFLRFVIGSKQFENYVRPITTGVNVPHLSGRQILNFKFRMPSLATQRRVAGILSAYDDLIENHLRRGQILERTVRDLYHEWFVEFRFPRIHSVPLVESPVGPVPEGWFGHFSDLATIERIGIAPTDYPDEEFEHFSIPAFDVDRRPVVESGATILSGKYAVDGSGILISKLNPKIPRVWMPNPTGGRRAICSTEFLVLKPRPGVTREFLYAQCCSHEFAGKFASVAIGTSTSHQRVRPENLLALRTVVPSKALIADFSSRVRSMLELSDSLRVTVHNLRAVRDLLSSRLMAGQVNLDKAGTRA